MFMELSTSDVGIAQEEPKVSEGRALASTHQTDLSREHFLVDMNHVFNFFGKRYFFIFYFGRHLHPRQRDGVNRRKWANSGVWLSVIVSLSVSSYGLVQLIAYRLAH